MRRESYENWDECIVSDDVSACLWLASEGLETEPMVCCRLADAVAVGKGLLANRVVHDVAYWPCCRSAGKSTCIRDEVDEFHDDLHERAVEILRMAAERFGLVWPEDHGYDYDDEKIVDGLILGHDAGCRCAYCSEVW